MRSFTDRDFEALRTVCYAYHMGRSAAAGKLPRAQMCCCGALDRDENRACAALAALWEAYTNTELSVPPPPAVTFDMSVMRAWVDGREYRLESDWTTEVYAGDQCIGKLEMTRGFGAYCAARGTEAERAQWQSDVDAMVAALRGARAPTPDAGWSYSRGDERAYYEGEAYGLGIRLLRLTERPGWRWHVVPPGGNSIGRGVLDRMDSDAALRAVQAVAWGFAEARHRNQGGHS